MGKRRKESLGKTAGGKLHGFTLHQTILGMQKNGKQMGGEHFGGRQEIYTDLDMKSGEDCWWKASGFYSSPNDIRLAKEWETDGRGALWGETKNIYRF